METSIQQETGIVKWFNANKGYGFITPDDADATQGQDVFVHHTGIEGEGYRNLYGGEPVCFELVDFGKGPQAQKVQRVNARVVMSDEHITR